jgi:phospholipid N-methyltransferase
MQLNRGALKSMQTGETALKQRRKLRLPKLDNVPLALFFREFCRNPTMIGSIIPSSDKLIEKMLSRIDWESTRLFVEYGPGVGTFTRPILDQLGPDATLLAIDTNRDFIRYLERTIDDPRLILVHGSAADVGSIIARHGFESIDYVLSGLPFSTLPPGVGPAIMRETHAALRPGGAFVIYQYALKVLRLLKPYFGNIDRDFEPMNIPPAQVFWAWKD